MPWCRSSEIGQVHPIIHYLGDKPRLTLQACGTFEADMHDEGEGEQREARIRKAGRVEKVTLLVSMCLLMPKLYLPFARKCLCLIFN